MKFRYIVIICLLFFIGCNFKKTVFSKDYFYMDTYFQVKIYSKNKKETLQALEEIDLIYNYYHRLTDRFHQDEELINVYYLNNILKVEESIKIDQELFILLKECLNYYEESNGLFNIALGNVLDVWHNYREKQMGVPTLEELKSSGSINIKSIVLNEDFTFKKKEDLKIDLGGIAKGYATKVVEEYLKEKGLTKYLINAGGHVTVGEHYNKGKYKIGIEDPLKDQEIFKVIKANNITVDTSGSYERYYEYKGVKYHHLIDPFTLFPPHYMLSVTVLTKDSMKADFLSTYLFLIPIEEGLEIVKKMDGVEALWYSNEGQVYSSKGIINYE
ncbi:MAG: FAD:protein FMN transferase [Bacilli bacterium]|jgi:thiamine biosynthesis lipoprotein